MLGPEDVSAGVLKCYPSSLLVYVCLFAVSRHGLSLPGTHQVPKLAGQRATRKPPVSLSPVITKHILPTLAFCMQILGTELRPYDWQGQVSSLTGTLFVCWFFLVMVSWCRPGCPGTHYIGRSGLKLTEIHLLLLPKCWDSSCGPLFPAFASITTPSTVVNAQSERFCAMTFQYSTFFKITSCVEFVRHRYRCFWSINSYPCT